MEHIDCEINVPGRTPNKHEGFVDAANRLQGVVADLDHLISHIKGGPKSPEPACERRSDAPTPSLLAVLVEGPAEFHAIADRIGDQVLEIRDLLF